MNRLICLLLTTLFVLSIGSAQGQLFSNKAKSTSIVNIGSQSYYVHTVKKDDTIFSLAKLYNVTQHEIIKYNPQAVDGIQLDQVLKIPITREEPTRKEQKAQAKLFDQHIVNLGETAYSIAKRYGLAVNVLVEDNSGVDLAVLSVGQKLNIRKSEMGDSDDSQIRMQLSEYKDKLNSVSTDFQYHVVAKGETIYSLSRQFGVSQEAIKTSNNLQDGLKLGSMIKIPMGKSVTTSVPAVPLTIVTKIVETESIDDNIKVRSTQNSPVLNVAMLLPIKSTGAANKSFVEFYQGALLAMEDIKAQGVSVELNLYNTGRSVESVAEIVGGRAFEQTDLIIGPVYEESLPPVLDFARKHKIAVVSPLANVEQNSSSLLYQLSPQTATKYDKMRDLLSPDKNIVVIGGATNDAEFEREITQQLPQGYRHFKYSRGMPTASIEGLISGEKDNVFVVLSSNEYNVDEILARISSVQNNLLARSIKNANITIVGSSRWNRFVGVDKNLYFKLRLCFITSYHADRSNERVSAFDKRYIAAFGSLPTLYSYRGYDAAKLFVDVASKPGYDFTDKLNDADTQLLQMPYRFVQNRRGDNNVNNQWALVTYQSNYTVTVQ